MNFLDRYFLTFVIFAVIGYICEVIYCSILDRKLVNRGFLHGPWLPIYGFGGLIIELFLVPLRAYPVAVFLLGVILTSSVEYFGSWMLEKLFDIKLWDYSHYRFHINGRVCLLNSSLFGIMGLVLVYGLEPYLNGLLNLIPEAMREPLSMVLASLFSIDLTLSIIRMQAFRKAMEETLEKVKAFREEGRAEKEILELREKTRVRFRRIVNAFPSLTARREEMREEVSALKAWALERRLLKAELKGEIRELILSYKAREKEIDERLRKGGKR